MHRIRVSGVLEFPDSLHAEDALSLAKEAFDANGEITASFVSRSLSFDAVLDELSRVLRDAGFRDMGAVQTMPGSNEYIQRFLRDRKELVDICSTDEPDKDVLEALLDEEEELSEER